VLIAAGPAVSQTSATALLEEVEVRFGKSMHGTTLVTKSMHGTTLVIKSMHGTTLVMLLSDPFCLFYTSMSCRGFDANSWAGCDVGYL
jgi:hypothetical protein